MSCWQGQGEELGEAEEQGWWGPGTREAGERGQHGAGGLRSRAGQGWGTGPAGQHRGAGPPGCWSWWSGLVGSGAGVLGADEDGVGEQEYMKWGRITTQSRAAAPHEVGQSAPT